MTTLTSECALRYWTIFDIWERDFFSLFVAIPRFVDVPNLRAESLVWQGGLAVGDLEDGVTTAIVHTGRIRDEAGI